MSMLAYLRARVEKEKERVQDLLAVRGIGGFYMRDKRGSGGYFPNKYTTRDDARSAIRISGRRPTHVAIEYRLLAPQKSLFGERH